LEQVNEINTPNKRMFATTHKSRIEQDEQELAELIALEKQKLEATKNEKDESNEEPRQRDEKSNDQKTESVLEGNVWEKRYKDAQRYITKLKGEIEVVKKHGQPLQEAPKTKEEIEAWMQKYPDVAAIVKTIAREQASENSRDIREQMEKLEEMRTEAIIAKTEAAIVRVHPDYFEIKDDSEFHKWAEDLPTAMQAVLYDTIDDPKGVSKIISLYKAESGTSLNSDPDRAAASAVSRKGAKSEGTTSTRNYDYTESQLAAMSDDEFARQHDKIMEARRLNRIKMDISGKK
jgi:hypothetical protein